MFHAHKLSSFQKAPLRGCFLLRVRIDSGGEAVYTGGAMKYIRKIVASGLIGVLAAFVDGFCLHPMTAQVKRRKTISQDREVVFVSLIRKAA